MAYGARVEEPSSPIGTLTELAERVDRCARGTAGPLFDPGAGPPDSFSAVIDALAAELAVPRSEILRCLIDDMRKQIATDRATLACLLSLGEPEPPGG
jgi:hypothetical protein